MWEQLKKLSAPLTSEDEEQQHIAVMLNTILPILLLASLLIIFITLISGYPIHSLIVAVGAAFVLAAFWWLRRGYLTLSATAITLTVLGVVTFTLYDLGTRGIAVLGYGIVIALAGLLLGKSAPVIFALLCSLSFFSVFLAEINGLIVTDYGISTFDDVLITSLILLTIALLVRIMITNWLDILAKVKHSERTLAQKNRELEYEIAERIRAEEALQTAKEAAEAASEAKSVFLGTMSHELRTPLAVIISYSELLQQTITDPAHTEKNASNLEKVLNSAQHLLAIVTDVLDFAEIDSGQFQLACRPIDFAPIMDECCAQLEPIAQKKNIHFECAIPSDLPPIFANPDALLKVFNKLVGNAIKFTEEGCVNVQVSLVENETLKGFPVDLSHQSAATAWIFIRVADTGIGIAPEHQEIIFDAFQQADGSYTRQYGGMGLGLAITHHLVEVMNGRVWVESELGAGSAFCVLLPAGVDQCP